MTSKQTTPNENLEYLHDLFRAATQEASAAMSRWTRGMVKLSLDEVKEVPLHAISTQFENALLPMNMVVLALEGEPGGTMVLAFDEDNGRQLAATLLGEEKPHEGDWSELETSALTETGNILACAYLNALNHIVDHVLTPTPPQFIKDFGASVLEQAFAAQAYSSDEITICRTTFHCEGKALSWDLFFVPSSEMREAMEHALDQKKQSFSYLMIVES